MEIVTFFIGIAVGYIISVVFIQPLVEKKAIHQGCYYDIKAEEKLRDNHLEHDRLHAEWRKANNLD